MAGSVYTAAGVVQPASLYSMNFAPGIFVPVTLTFSTSKAVGRT